MDMLVLKTIFFFAATTMFLGCLSIGSKNELFRVDPDGIM